MGRMPRNQAGYGLLRLLVAAITIGPIVLLGVTRGLAGKLPVRTTVAEAELADQLGAMIDKIGNRLAPAQKASLAVRDRVLTRDGRFITSDWGTSPKPLSALNTFLSRRGTMTTRRA